VRRFTIILIAVLYLFSGSLTGVAGCNCSGGSPNQSAEEFCHHDGSPTTQPEPLDCCSGHCCHGASHFTGAILQPPEVASVRSRAFAAHYAFNSLTHTSVPLLHPPIGG